MNKQNIEALALAAEKTESKRDQRKRRRMKVSGAGVKNLQRIIAK